MVATGKKQSSEYTPSDPPAGAVSTTLEVPPELDGSRLDRAAAQLFNAHSRARLQAWIEAGWLRRNGQPCLRVREAVRAGDALTLAEPPVAATEAPAAQAIPLDVVYADDALAVINKPAGLTVHPGAGISDGTLQNALLHRFPQAAGVPRAGLVHRLDRDTSGLLLVALTLAAHTQLVRAMARREIGREYLALVRGALTGGGRIEAAIGRDPRHRQRMAVLETGRPAVTHYAIERRFAHHTLLRVRLETGRTHQIRVHLAHRRHPLVGDPVYGSHAGVPRSLPAAAAAVLAGFARQALHARELRFAHPFGGHAMCLQAPLPADFESLLAALAQARAT